MTQIHNGSGLGSEEVLFTNCNFRFLFVWSSRVSLFMTDVELCSWTFIKTYDLFFPKFPFKLTIWTYFAGGFLLVANRSISSRVLWRMQSWSSSSYVQASQDGTDRHLAAHLTTARPSTSEFPSGQELLLEKVVIFTCMINMFKFNAWLLIYYFFFFWFLNFKFRHFLCHIVVTI